MRFWLMTTRGYVAIGRYAAERRTKREDSSPRPHHATRGAPSDATTTSVLGGSDLANRSALRAINGAHSGKVA